MRKWIAILVALLVGAAATIGLWYYRASRTEVVRAGDTYSAVDGRHAFGESDHTLEGYNANLSLIDDRCLALPDREGTERIVIWPHGTKVRSDHGTVVVQYGDVRLTFGQPVSYGIDSYASTSDLALPNGCSNKPAMLVYDPAVGQNLSAP